MARSNRARPATYWDISRVAIRCARRSQRAAGHVDPGLRRSALGHFQGRRRQPGSCSKSSLTFWSNYWDKPLGHFPGWLQSAVAADLTVSSSCLAVAVEAYWDIFRVGSGVWMRAAGVGWPPCSALGHGYWDIFRVKSAAPGPPPVRKAPLGARRETGSPA